MHAPCTLLNEKATKMLKKFWIDEHGVVLSAELILVGTILILGMIVGLVELQCAVVAELSDLGDAIGNVDQSYRIPGMTSFKNGGGVKAQTSGAAFNDGPDAGDCNSIITCDNAVSGGEKSNLSRGANGSLQGQGFRQFEFDHGHGTGRNIGRPDVRRLGPHSQNDRRPHGPILQNKHQTHDNARNAERRKDKHEGDHHDHDDDRNEQRDERKHDSDDDRDDHRGDDRGDEHDKRE